MARVNVYLPDDLAEAARAVGLNMSNVTQQALRRELACRDGTAWLQRVRRERPAGVPHQLVLTELDAARQEAGDDWPAEPGAGPPA
ncbi:MAG: type II toxin-antitoxin system CcdA family antitoxin [Candidatus Dormibacteria bacterium]